jgi:hypothetical protein
MPLPPFCPSCGLPGVPIRYGYPGPGALAQADAGLAVLGGCVVRPEQPDYACPRHHGWRRGTMPAGATPSDLAAAERHYRAALAEADPGERGPLRHALAIVLAAAGRPDEARAAYEAATGAGLDGVEERYRAAREALTDRGRPDRHRTDRG